MPSKPNGNHAATVEYAKQQILWPKKNPEKLYAIALTRAPTVGNPRLRAGA
jgi:hypothetical protein